MAIRASKASGKVSALAGNASIGCISDATPRVVLSASIGQSDSGHLAQICSISKKGTPAFLSTKGAHRFVLGWVKWRASWLISQHHGHARRRRNLAGIPCFSRRSVSSDLLRTLSLSPWLTLLATRPLAYRSRIARPANTVPFETSPRKGGRTQAAALLGVVAPFFFLLKSKVRPC